MRRVSLWLAVVFALAMVVLVLPTSQAASDTGCLVLNQRTHQLFKTLQAGIDAARPADTLAVVGICHGISTIDKELNLRGVGPGALGATLDGDGMGSVLTVNEKIAVGIDRLAITNGTATSGGGIVNYGKLRLDRATVKGNTADYDGGPYWGGGGGVLNYGTLALTGSTVRDNTASYVGGGILSINGAVTLIASTIRDNAAGAGGGIFNTNGSVTLSGSILSHNSAAGNGGAVWNDYTLELTNGSTVKENTAAQLGGGICNIGGAVTLTNANVSRNAATTGEGGGIYSDSFGTLALTNSTVSRNSGPSSGADIFSLGALTLVDSR